MDKKAASQLEEATTKGVESGIGRRKKGSVLVIKRELILNRKQSNMSDSRSPRSYDGGDHYIV